MQNVVEIIILSVFLSYHNLKIHLSVIGKDPCLSVFDLFVIVVRNLENLLIKHRYHE